VLNLETGVPTKEGNMKADGRFRIVLLVMLVVVILPSAGLASTGAKVMTYNVDEGTDFAAIIAVLTNSNATATDFQNAVQQTIGEVVASNPSLRAFLIANEIKNTNPDLVGLQEAAVWTFNGQQLDLRQLILDDLAALGQHYTAVVTVPEFQINIAQLGVGFTDRDVILARTALANTPGAIRGTYGYYNHLVQLPASAFLPATSITRGWASADVTLNGTKFRFITTHLEDGTNTTSPIFALVQAEQEIELINGPARTALPEIIAGDFNTVANDPSSPTFLTYLFMLGNGFTDAWRRTHPFLIFSGATCCQADLTISASELTQRLDQVFVRNHVGVVFGGTQLVGNHLDSSIYGDSWPSDHAAVESALQVTPVL
jgi:endonuclease/exonuclease/phosphatase family metal-dependent hydrolase